MTRLVAHYNYRVDIYTRHLQVDSSKKNPQIENLLHGKLRVIRLGQLSNFNNPLARLTWLISVVISIYKEQKLQKYEIISGNAFSGAIPTWLLGKLLNRPTVFTVHGSPLMDAYPRSLGALVEKILLTQINFTQELSVSYRFLKYKNVNKSICVIPNGVTLNKYSPAKKNNKFTILWVGRFDRIKGLDILIESFSRLDFEKYDCQLTLVGSGVEKSIIENLVVKNNLTNVQFIPKVQHKRIDAYFRQSHLFVLPSRAEGSPISLFESWAAQCPVLVTDVGDNRRYVEEGINGYLVQPNNIKQLTHKMMAAIKNKNLSRMGNAGYILVKKRLSWDDIVTQHDMLYQKIKSKYVT